MRRGSVEVRLRADDRVPWRLEGGDGHVELERAHVHASDPVAVAVDLAQGPEQVENRIAAGRGIGIGLVHHGRAELEAEVPAERVGELRVDVVEVAGPLGDERVNAERVVRGVEVRVRDVNGRVLGTGIGVRIKATRPIHPLCREVSMEVPDDHPVEVGVSRPTAEMAHKLNYQRSGE